MFVLRLARTTSPSSWAYPHGSAYRRCCCGFCTGRAKLLKIVALVIMADLLYSAHSAPKRGQQLLHWLRLSAIHTLLRPLASLHVRLESLSWFFDSDLCCVSIRRLQKDQALRGSRHAGAHDGNAELPAQYSPSEVAGVFIAFASQKLYAPLPAASHH
jgi:hypothetical protein